MHTPQVLEDAQQLCRLLAREFSFAPVGSSLSYLYQHSVSYIPPVPTLCLLYQPCVDLWSVLNDTLESFLSSELLRVPSERVGGRRVPHPPQEIDNEDGGEYVTGITLEVGTQFF